MVKTNLKKHEIIGLFMLFLSGSLIGIGLYVVVWGAVKPLLYGNINYILKGKELLAFPLFFGLGFVFWALGTIELKDIRPGK